MHKHDIHTTILFSHAWYNVATMYTVNQIFSTALRAFSGTSRNSFADPNGIVADATRTVATTVDLTESKRVVPLEPALYTGDNLYFCPSDANTIVDIEPGSGRSSTESAQFNRAAPIEISRDFNHENVNFATEWRNGVKLLRIQPGAINDTPIMIHGCNSTSDNGTVTVSGDASNLDVNSVFYINGTSSLDFNLGGATTTASLIFSGITSVDISSTTRDGAITMGIFVPEALVGKISQLTIHLGTDASNHYEMTATQTAYGADFIHGFNIVRFERRGALEAGSPDEADITYARLTITLSEATAVTGVKIDAIYAHKGIGYNLHYYSDAHFMSSEGAFLKIPNATAYDDVLVGGEEVFQMVVEEAKKIMDMSLRGEKGGAVYKMADRELNGIWGDFSRPGLYEQYRLRFPSTRRSVVTQYESYPYE